MRRIAVVCLLAALVAAQEGDSPATKPDPAQADYDKGLSYLKRKRWSLARKAFRRLIKKYPDSPLAEAAAKRSDDNCYLGTEMLWKSGPPEKRIDVAVMGDGFTSESGLQRKQEKWAKLCVDVLWNEPALSRYRSYFNVYFVRLSSFEEGVDPRLTPEQRKKIEDKNRYRSKSRQKKTSFSTALEAKAAGPQGQVMMDRGLVYKWLAIANEDVPGVGDDRYVIAFAQFGRLGMGGGGIANVGRPDKSVTTHEFGHAFSRLLDEYAISPAAPRRPIRAPNAYSSADKPKPEVLPWAHLLKLRTKGVGIYEGGATFKKGVWRPAPSCAMNAAGATGFCPVCREQTIKVIYEYISPIEDHAPKVDEEEEGGLSIVAGDPEFLMVQPMEPYKDKLKVSWYVADFAVTKSEAAADDSPGDGRRRVVRTWGWSGKRARQDRSAYANPPRGKLRKWGKVLKGKGRGAKRVPSRYRFPLSKLGPGNWQVTCEVADTTRWVVKDEKHLLKERVSWTIRVKPKPSPANRKK